MDITNIINQIAGILQVRPMYVKSVLDLLEDGGTVPFIARYRKEKTGAMNESDIRTVRDEYTRLYEMEERRNSVLASIRLQDMFQALEQKQQLAYEKKILNAKTLTEIEDLYRPYKPKRQSRAQKALNKGLGKLANIIKEEREGTEEDRSEILKQFITPTEDREKKDYKDIVKKIKKAIKEESDPRKLEKLKSALKKAQEDMKKAKEKEDLIVKDEKEAISGAIDILSEEISNNADFRKYIRSIVFEESVLVSTVAKAYKHLHLTAAEKAEIERKRQEELEAQKKKEEQIMREKQRLLQLEQKKRKMSAAQKKKLEEEERKKRLEEYEKEQMARAKKKSTKKLSIKERIRLQQEQLRKEELERKRKKEELLLRKQHKEVGDLIGTPGSAADGKKGKGKGGALGEDANIDPLVYEMYFEYEQLAKDIPPHRILAINRGEKEKVLSVSFKHPEEDLLEWLKAQCFNKTESLFVNEYFRAIRLGYRRIILSIERELRSDMRERAEEHAISVFAKNLGSLLMQPPLKGRGIIAIDPGYAHGCKIAVIDEKGQYIDTSKYVKDNIIYPTPGPKQNINQARRDLLRLMKEYNAYTISIGNGTASREAEQFAAAVAKEERKMQYCIVNEAGASVYSASDLAAEEFPDLSVEARGAISIARRLQDPLSELIKIDPKSIGVGLYQHDVNQIALKKQLDGVIEDCVNQVGVLVNSASYKLLEYVSGLNKRLARNIYNYTKTHPIDSREDLKKIPGIGDKAFEQCAGFLKIMDGLNPLDATTIHPESYWIVEEILKYIGEDKSILIDPSRRDELSDKIKQIKPKELISFMGRDVGLPTLRDIVMALLRPGRDPRDDLPPPILKKDVLHAKDLRPDMILKGTVRNVVDFGAFVDIGLHDDGLIHISEMKRLDGKSRFIKDPTEVLSVGDIIEVRVLKVDIRKFKKGGREQEKVKIALSMYLEDKEKEIEQSRKNRGTYGGGNGNNNNYNNRSRNSPQNERSFTAISFQKEQNAKLIKADFNKEKLNKAVAVYQKGIKGIQYRSENQGRILNRYIPISKSALSGLIILAVKRYLRENNLKLVNLATMSDDESLKVYRKVYNIVKLGVKECLNSKTGTKTSLVEQAFRDAESDFLSVL
ncbi:MAG: Tex-like N-terminal domain-containing protein [Candidatus Njordarchaeales archaeon]